MTDDDPFAHSDFETFFSYVQNHMLRDISAALNRLVDDDGRGLFMIALAELCGTEALGQWMPGAKTEQASRHNFAKTSSCSPPGSTSHAWAIAIR